MTTTNNFLPFGTGVGANVLGQSEYNALAARSAGFSAGVAKSEELNKVWRQSSFMCAALGKLIADRGYDALDDGDVAALTAKIAAILRTGSFLDVVSYSTDATLTSADLGKFVILDKNASTQLINLPDSSSVPTGTAYTFLVTGYGATITPYGSEHIYGFGSPVSSVALGTMDTLKLVARSASGGWLAEHGTTQAGQSAAFKNAKSVNGYQRLPSGLIVQWGEISVSANSFSASYPITYPNAVLSRVATIRDKTSGSEAINILLTDAANTTSTIGGSFQNYVTGQCTIKYMSIGY